MKKLLMLIISASILSASLSGCTFKKVKPVSDMPSDKPWNNFIMETNNGYYYNLCDQVHSMRYSEKSNYANIFLCAKPECAHDGVNTCTATFNFLECTNHVLYDDAIYFASETYEKDCLAYSLYKESLDGTTLDKLCDISKLKYPSDKLDGYGFLDKIIIHKGYAFVPYNMGHSNTYTDFVESGLAKVDIQTGKCEKIIMAESYPQSAEIYLYAGLGDYVYYRGQSSDSRKNGLFKYNINDGSIEKLEADFVPKLCDDEHSYYQDRMGNDTYSITGITEDAFYVTYKNGMTNTLTGYDAKTLKPNGFKIDMPVEGKFDAKAVCYDGKIFVFDIEEIRVYSDKGELLGSHGMQTYLTDDETAEFCPERRKFDISDGKVYVKYLNPDMIDFKSSEYEPDTDKNDGDDDEIITDAWYCCPVEDIISGTGKWKKAYSVYSETKYWKDESPMPKYVEQYIIPKWNDEIH